jgi:formylmethanofuran dehydrogenase subunit E
MSSTTTGAKICNRCGRNVAGEKRIKDREGNYWCADCNRAHQKRERLIEGGICVGCGEAYHGPGLTLIGDETFCKRCLKTRAKQETSGFVHNVRDMLSGSRDEEKRKTLVLIIFSAVIVLAAVWQWLL